MGMAAVTVSADQLFTVTARHIIIKALQQTNELILYDEEGNEIARAEGATEFEFEFDSTKTFTFKANVDVEVTYE